ncbi:MAG TPA: NUDIX hydrolase [Trueperaceae bacterium]
MSGRPKGSPKASREVIYEGAILDLVRLDGKWDVVEHLPAVAILVLEGRQVLGVRQTRHPLAERTWEIPAGLIDEGESPEETARRELAEEVGLGGRLELVTRIYTSPGFTDELIYLFEASDLEPAHAEGDEDEELELAWMDVKEAWNAISEGRIASSAPTLVALSYAMAQLGIRCR